MLQLADRIISGPTPGIGPAPLNFWRATIDRHLDTPAESALRSANQRFARRFSDLETMARSAGIVLSEASPAVLESLWSRAKSLEEG